MNSMSRQNLQLRREDIASPHARRPHRRRTRHHRGGNRRTLPHPRISLLRSPPHPPLGRQTRGLNVAVVFNRQASYNLNGTCARSATSATRSSSCIFYQSASGYRWYARQHKSHPRRREMPAFKLNRYPPLDRWIGQLVQPVCAFGRKSRSEARQSEEL